MTHNLINWLELNIAKQALPDRNHDSALQSNNATLQPVSFRNTQQGTKVVTQKPDCMSNVAIFTDTLDNLPSLRNASCINKDSAANALRRRD